MGKQYFFNILCILLRITIFTFPNYVYFFSDPTPEVNELLPVTWEPVTKDTRPYLVIDVDIRLGHRIYKDRMAFWDLFYIAYGRYNKYLRECTITN